MEEIDRRRSATLERIGQLQANLASANHLLNENACVYATGSFGRLEAGDNSDLDLFILALNKYDNYGKYTGGRLRGLDAICIKAELINATSALGIPDFDGDGRYLLTHYSVNDFTKTLGMPEDDLTNTFTARLLLLLESSPLLGAEVYKSAVSEVLASYFRDYPDHSSEFVPAFLGNDILRLWRTFCVNYEARTAREPEDKKRKGKVKNYKLKHSRLLTCYPALLYLLVVFKLKNTVAPSDVTEMVSLTPIGRLKWIMEIPELESSKGLISQLLTQYDTFLTTTADEADLADRLMSKTDGRLYYKSTYVFGDTMFEAVNTIGEGSRLHRLLVV